MILQQQLNDLIIEIVKGYRPEKIYLFGSYANNTATDDSDIDLFIIKNTNAKKNRTQYTGKRIN